MTGCRFLLCFDLLLDILWQAYITEKKNMLFPYYMHFIQNATTYACAYGILNPPCTANQSFKSSFAGNLTTSLRSIPELSEAFACLCKLNFKLPGSNLFLGLKVCNKFELFCYSFFFHTLQKRTSTDIFLSHCLSYVQCINVHTRGKWRGWASCPQIIKSLELCPFWIPLCPSSYMLF